MPDATIVMQHPGENLLNPHDWDYIAGYFALSEREAFVARMVFEGKPREDIAAATGCTVNTVRTYVARVFTKLDVEDRLAMALRVMQAHLQKR